MLVARAGDGSMRDAQSALDQVIAFAGTKISADDVTTVLGLVRRDLLLDIADAVAREDSAAAFALAGQAVESGYDLRSVVRELARLTRDLLVVRIDASRVDRSRDRRRRRARAAQALARKVLARRSHARFDVLTKAEYDIRRLAPALSPRDGAAALDSPAQAGAAERSDPGPRVRAARLAAGPGRSAASGRARHRDRQPLPPPQSRRSSASRPHRWCQPVDLRGAARRFAWKSSARPRSAVPNLPVGTLKERVLATSASEVLLRYLVAQAQRIDVEADRIVFVFGPQHRRFGASSIRPARCSRISPAARGPADVRRFRGGQPRARRNPPGDSPSAESPPPRSRAAKGIARRT